MAIRYYSRQYYNQLKRKQYEEYLKMQNWYYLYKKKYYEEYHQEYLKRQNEYYLYERKYYEEYIKRHNGHYLYKKKYYEGFLKRRNKYYLYQKKYYEEYIKRQKAYYLYMKKYDEEHHKRNNNDFANKRKYDKTYTSESELFNSFKAGSTEDNSINEDNIKDNSEGAFKINIEEYLGEDHNIHKNQVDKCNIQICKTTVSSESLPLCENIPHTSDVTAGPVTVKIPVVLTECNITITIQSSLKLEDDLLEIKHIRKNVYLNQCKLIPNSENNKPNTGILFLAGFIRKNIEYATKEHNDKDGLSGKIKHATVNVPFKCTTRVTFNTPPKFKANTSQEEVEILQTNIRVCNPCEEEIIGADIREQSFRLIEFFNEKVFCELISAEFVESDILENPINKKCKSPLKQTFHDITEKVVLFLTIKLLQNQNVIVPK